MATSGLRVRFYFGTQAQYNSLPDRSPNILYFAVDTANIYLGDNLVTGPGKYYGTMRVTDDLSIYAAQLGIEENNIEPNSEPESVLSEKASQVVGLKVNFYVGTQAEYNAIAHKIKNMVYLITDTRRIYVGEDLYTGYGKPDGRMIVSDGDRIAVKPQLDYDPELVDYDRRIDVDGYTSTQLSPQQSDVITVRSII